MIRRDFGFRSMSKEVFDGFTLQILILNRWPFSFEQEILKLLGILATQNVSFYQVIHFRIIKINLSSALFPAV